MGHMNILKMSLIRNEDYLKQSIDFTGIGNSKIHPSDIDAVLEFDNKYLILMEFKHNGINIPIGQKLLLERISNSWNISSAEKKSVILKIKHNTNNGLINAVDCKVIEIYENVKWHKIKMSLIKCLNKLGHKWNSERIKNL